MKKYVVLFFLLNPFIGANYALLNVKNNKRLSSIIWLLFCFLFGYFYIIPADGGDYHTYLNRFNMISRLNFIGFLGYLSDKLDFISFLFLYILSFITNNFQLVWGLISLFFGYLVLKIFINISRFVDEKILFSPHLFKITSITLIFIASLFLLYNFRFWIGANLIYLGISYYLLGNTKTMYLCFLFAVLTHFSLIICVLLILFVIHQNVKINYLIIFSLLSIVIGQLGLLSLAEYIPQSILDSRGHYLTDESIQNYQNVSRNVNWYVFGVEIMLYYTVLFFIILNIKNIKLINDKKKISLASMVLLSYSFANLIVTLPLAERFRRIALFIGILYLFLTSFAMKTKCNGLVYAICILFLIVETRKIFDNLNLGLIIPTGVPCFFLEDTSVFSFIFN